MRGVLFALGLGLGLGLAPGVLGCHHDKYGITPPSREDYSLPPDEPRYNRPDTAGYRKPPPRDEKNHPGGTPPRFGTGGF